MQNAGLIESVATASSDQITSMLPRLNDLINVWQTEGLKLWLTRSVTVPLVAGQPDYELGPSLDVSMARPLRVDGAWYVTTAGNRRELTVAARKSYRTLPNLTQQGSINTYYTEKLPAKLVVWFWNAPTAAEAAAGSVELDVRSQVTGFDAVTASTSFPDEWALALQWGLADEISTGQPQVIMDRCQQRAQVYKEKLDSFEVEDAPIQMSVDMPISGYGTGGFV